MNLNRLKQLHSFPILAFLFLSSSLSLSQTLTFNEIITDGVGGVEGLDGTYGIVISPDDKHVYTASSTDEAVSAFSRNSSTGKLTYIETHVDDIQGGLIDQMDGAKRLCISPDGNHIYVPSSTDDGLVVFSRNSTSGVLTHIETHKDLVDGVTGLNGAYECAVSPDNKHVYVAGSVSDAAVVFSRNTGTGALTFVEAHVDAISGVDGLNGSRAVKLSNDGNYAYFASSIDDAVAIFSRNSTTGALTYISNSKDGFGGVDGLNGAYGLAISPDDDHLYVAGSSDDAVAVFTRNTATGALTYIEHHKDDTQGGLIANLNAVRNVAVSHDGAYVAAASSTDDGLVIFSRNATTGALTLDEEHKQLDPGVDGLDGARMVIFANSDQSVLVAASTSDGIANFIGPTPLPIELISFKVSRKNKNVLIQWQTATELNNDHFIIERSDASGFFHEIETINGAGHSNTILDYETTDTNPLRGIAQYRIKQVDFDGTITYSPIRLIDQSQNTVSNIIIYPNPAQSKVTISSDSKNEFDYISMRNTVGENVLTSINHTIIDPGIITIQLNEFDAGMYILRTRTQQNIITVFK